MAGVFSSGVSTGGSAPAFAGNYTLPTS